MPADSVKATMQTPALAPQHRRNVAQRIEERIGARQTSQQLCWLSRKMGNFGGTRTTPVELFLTMAFRMVSSLRMQATKATFFALPAASSLW